MAQGARRAGPGPGPGQRAYWQGDRRPPRNTTNVSSRPRFGRPPSPLLPVRRAWPTWTQRRRRRRRRRGESALRRKPPGLVSTKTGRHAAASKSAFSTCAPNRCWPRGAAVGHRLRCGGVVMTRWLTPPRRSRCCSPATRSSPLGGWPPRSRTMSVGCSATARRRPAAASWPARWRCRRRCAPGTPS